MIFAKRVFGLTLLLGAQLAYAAQVEVKLKQDAAAIQQAATAMEGTLDTYAANQAEKIGQTFSLTDTISLEKEIARITQADFLHRAGKTTVLKRRFKNIHVELAKKRNGLIAKQKETEQQFIETKKKAQIYVAVCLVFIVLSMTDKSAELAGTIIPALIARFGLQAVGLMLMIFDILKEKLLTGATLIYCYKTWDLHQERKQLQQQLDTIQFPINPWEREADELEVVVA